MASELFEKFTKERNLKQSTKKGYETALKNYTNFWQKPIEHLLGEAKDEEERNVPLKDRKVKKRLLDYRSHLFKSNYSNNTVKTYFTSVETFYTHFEIELPNLPNAKYDSEYITSYHDLPTRKDIRLALDISAIDVRSVILFMSSSGTAKAETLSLTVDDFIRACDDYHKGGRLEEILDELSEKSGIVATFYLKRIKTGKYYYTFCSSEASREIVKYLKGRKNLKRGIG